MTSLRYQRLDIDEHEDQSEAIDILLVPFHVPDQFENHDELIDDITLEEYESAHCTVTTNPLTSSGLPDKVSNVSQRISPPPRIKRKPVPASNAKSTNVPKEKPVSSPEPSETPDIFMGERESVSRKPWKPFMLRKFSVIALILACWTMVAALELLRHFAIKFQGFSTENKATVGLLRYLPTVVVIALAFVWKSLVHDLKVVAPYSAMTDRWATSSKSLLLDYVDPLEILSVWKSARNRHWAVFIGLVAGLLSGLLVPLANSLTVISLSSPVSSNVEIRKATEFSFLNSLADDNGTLSIPWDYRGNQPYASILSSRQSNGKQSPWTVEDYAFESFDLSISAHIDNATIYGSTEAFNAPFDCLEIGYTIVPVPDWIIVNVGGDGVRTAYVPNEADLATAGCQPYMLGSPLHSDDSGAPSVGWLNITDCSGDGIDVRMLATVADLTSNKTVGLLCRPQYFLRDATIGVNASTGSISSFELNDNTTKPILPADLPVIVMYLNNPMSLQAQTAWLEQPHGPYVSVEPQATFANVTSYSFFYGVQDVFFEQLYINGRTAEEYIKRPDLLNSEVAELCNVILTQVINAFSRVPSQDFVHGSSVVIYQPRILVRELLLRMMEAILIIMSLIVGLCSSVFRPRGQLTENPSSIAAASVLLGNSGDTLEYKLLDTVLLNVSATEEFLAGWQWTLSRSQKGEPIIEGKRASFQSPRTLGAKREDNSQSGSFQGPKKDSTSEQSAIKMQDYQPILFYWIPRILLLFSLCAVVISLGVLLRVSNINGGFPVASETASFAWVFVPSTILVLLGYCLSGIDGALRLFAPYLALRNTSGQRSIIYHYDSSPFTMPLYAVVRLGSITLAISSFSVIIFPAVKIVAAGLYIPVPSTHIQTVQISIDCSLINNIEAVYEDADNVVTTASQFADWTKIPSFGVSERAGALQNFVFSNLTGIDKEESLQFYQESQLTVRVPAVAVDVMCSSLGPEDFEPTVSLTDVGYGTVFQFSLQCATTKCNQTLSGGWGGINYIPGGGVFAGLAIVDGYYRATEQTLFDTGYQVTLANFSGVRGPLENFTAITEDQQVLVPGMLNISRSAFPTMVAANCTKTLWEVDVDAIFTRNFRINVNSTTTLPWAVFDFDKSSVVYKRKYNSSTPISWYPPPNYPTQYTTDAQDGTLSSDSLQPSLGLSTNFFELLASYGQFELGNTSKLLEQDGFEAATKAMFTSYIVEILTDLRPYASNFSTENPLFISGSLANPLTRMKQDQTATIFICVLLGLMLCGLMWIFWSFPKKSVLPKAPSSIAAQMSLLAGSKLVQKLRDEKVQSSYESTLWGGKFRLGWWPHEEEGDHVSVTQRWGIDIVNSTRKQKVISST